MKKEKTNIASGVLIAIALSWAGWVSITLYSQNGTISSMATKQDYMLNLLAGKDIIPTGPQTAINN